MVCKIGKYANTGIGKMAKAELGWQHISDRANESDDECDPKTERQSFWVQ